MSHKVVAIIPARGGSKGIPHKNISTIKYENGRSISLLENSLRRISPLVEKGTIDEVWVATDSNLISNHILELRELNDPDLAIPFVYLRLSENATDESSTEDLLLEFVEERDLDNNDILVTIQCTSPFIDSDTLFEAIENVSYGDYQSAVSVTRTHRFFWKRKWYTDEGVAVNYIPTDRPRRQDIKEEFFIENGAFYVTRCNGLRATKSRLLENIYLAIQEEEYTNIEIDEPVDLDIARRLMEIENTI